MIARSPIASIALVGALALALACGARTGEPAASGRAERIASQTILSDELLHALGPAVQARVVAVSPLVDDPRYSAIVGAWPGAVPRLAGTSESLLALRPDLVIIASFTAPETRAFLGAHGVRALELDTFSGFADLDRHTRAIAAAVDAEAEGEALIAARAARLRALAEDHGRGRALAAIAWGDGLLAGSETTFSAIADAAGLKNMAEEKGLKGHVSIPIEAIVAWDPEAIVIGCEPPSCAEAEAEMRARPGIAATRAARGGAVIGIPTRFLASTGDGMLTAAELLQARRIALGESAGAAAAAPVEGP